MITSYRNTWQGNLVLIAVINTFKNQYFCVFYFRNCFKRTLNTVSLNPAWHHYKCLCPLGLFLRGGISQFLDRASCEATLPSSAPPLSVEGGSVTAFLSTLVGNSYPSFGKCCLNGLGVLHLSPKTLNLCMEEFRNVGPSLPMHERI